MQQRRDHRPGRAEQAKGCRGDDRQGPAEADRHVDLQGPPALPAEPHAGAEPAQVAADQHDIRRGQGDIGAAGTHCHPDHTGLQRQRIVDAVADHHRPETAADLRADLAQLVLRQRLRHQLANPHLLGHGVGHRLAIAGQQQLPAQTQFA